MGRIPEETIREIRDRVDIVGLVGRYVDLKKAGRNLKGLCPFHDEKTPSFNVQPDRQIFHCFGCGEGGDVITFLQRHDGLSFPEAARMLARELGIEIPETSGGDSGLIARLAAANDTAQQLYRDALSSESGAGAREYLERRGLDSASIERFGVGYAPDSWDAVGKALASAGLPAEVGERAGLLKPRQRGGGHYDHLRGRIVFPIFDVRGQVIGFGARALAEDQQPKYLNTPETPLFRKREALYGFPFALEAIRRSQRVIICEGYFDRIALERAGLAESLATCGTALTSEHARQLKRRTREVVLLFDGDAAGQKAIERALEVLLPAGLNVCAASLPAEHDPDTYLVAHGGEALKTLVDSAPDALDVVMQFSLARGCASPAEKADVAEQMARLVALIDNPVKRGAYDVRRLALGAHADPSAVNQVVRRAATSQSEPGRGAGRGAGRSAVGSAVPSGPRRETRQDHHLRRLTSLLVRYGDLSTTALRDEIDEILPRGSWQSLLLCLIDSAIAGRIDASGAVDLFGVEQELDSDARQRLSEAAVQEVEFSEGTTPAQVLSDMLSWFRKRRRSETGENIARQLKANDASVSESDATIELQRRLEDKVASSVQSDAHLPVQIPDEHTTWRFPWRRRPEKSEPAVLPCFIPYVLFLRRRQTTIRYTPHSNGSM